MQLWEQVEWLCGPLPLHLVWCLSCHESTTLAVKKETWMCCAQEQGQSGAHKDNRRHTGIYICTFLTDSNLSDVGNVHKKLALCHGAAPCWARPQRSRRRSSRTRRSPTAHSEGDPANQLQICELQQCQAPYVDLETNGYGFTSAFQILCKFFLWPFVTQKLIEKEILRSKVPA